MDRAAAAAAVPINSSSPRTTAPAVIPNNNNNNNNNNNSLRMCPVVVHHKSTVVQCWKDGESTTYFMDKTNWNDETTVITNETPPITPPAPPPPIIHGWSRPHTTTSSSPISTAFPNGAMVFPPLGTKLEDSIEHTTTTANQKKTFPSDEDNVNSMSPLSLMVQHHHNRSSSVVTTPTVFVPPYNHHQRRGTSSSTTSSPCYVQRYHGASPMRNIIPPPPPPPAPPSPPPVVHPDRHTDNNNNNNNYFLNRSRLFRSSTSTFNAHTTRSVSFPLPHAPLKRNRRGATEDVNTLVKYNHHQPNSQTKSSEDHAQNMLHTRVATCSLDHKLDQLEKWLQSNPPAVECPVCWLCQSTFVPWTAPPTKNSESVIVSTPGSMDLFDEMIHSTGDDYCRLARCAILKCQNVGSILKSSSNVCMVCHEHRLLPVLIFKNHSCLALSDVQLESDTSVLACIRKVLPDPKHHQEQRMLYHVPRAHSSYAMHNYRNYNSRNNNKKTRNDEYVYHGNDSNGVYGGDGSSSHAKRKKSKRRHERDFFVFGVVLRDQQNNNNNNKYATQHQSDRMTPSEYQQSNSRSPIYGRYPNNQHGRASNGNAHYSRSVSSSTWGSPSTPTTSASESTTTDTGCASSLRDGSPPSPLSRPGGSRKGVPATGYNNLHPKLPGSNGPRVDWPRLMDPAIVSMPFRL